MRLNPAKMRCPQCKAMLTPPTQESLRIWGCTHCGGRLLALSALVHTLRPQAAQWVLEMAPSAPKSFSRRCPSCNDFLGVVPLEARYAGIEIDVCPKCQLMYFDRQELLTTTAGKAHEPPDNTPLLGPISHEDHPAQLLAGLLALPTIHEGKAAPEYVSFLSSASLALALSIIVIFYATTAKLDFVVQKFAFHPENAFRIQNLHQWISAFFLHADLRHLFRNMYFLLLFGIPIESHQGKARLLEVVFISTLAAHFTVVQFNPFPEIPHLGASGGISGLIGYFCTLRPNAKIGILVGRIPKIYWLHFPAILLALAYFAMDYFSFQLALRSGVPAGVGYEAHLGGLVAGVALRYVLPTKQDH
jgi:membrane associated rhomboid family serine protease/Zn-finger nucleic acid-binding protein